MTRCFFDAPITQHSAVFAADGSNRAEIVDVQPVSPAAHSYLGITGPWLQLILLVVGLGALTFILYRRYQLLRRAAPDPRFDKMATRFRRLLVLGFGQSRQPRYRIAGFLHILLFYGFLILSVRALALLGEGFHPGLADIGLGYNSVKDYTALVILLCCLVAAVRRLVFRPSRYHDKYATSSSHEALVILGLIAFLMLADACYEGTGLALTGEPRASLPLAASVAGIVDGGSVSFKQAIHLWSFWSHNVALLFFLCYLPVSKHFHVITALPNVFFLNLAPAGKVKPPRHDESDLDQLGNVGVGQLEDFTWKHILDFYSCTDCGRCSDHCPAYAIGAPLSPRMISIKCRDAAYAAYPIFARQVPAEERPVLVGDTIREEELWSCTTCGACEEACPVLIEYVDKIVDMRRSLVDRGQVPKSLQKPMTDLERRGNPYGKMPRKRGDWIEQNDRDHEIRLLAKGDNADMLFFTDSCAAFDPRIQRSALALGTLLSRAGGDVGTMGKDEVDSGHEAQRFGEEGLFETLRDKNTTAMAARHFRCVVTTDPHAFNALHHSYQLDQPVFHHSQLLDEIIEAGKLRFERVDDDRVYTFHDPCYLGRHNGIYDAPRRVLSALPGLKTVEMARTKNRSFCCGGGSLNLFHEGESDQRMGELRLEMARDAGAQVVVTACPFCLLNLEDAVKTGGHEEQMEVIELAELAQRHLADGANPSV